MDIAPELFVGRRDRFVISRRLQSFFACFCVLGDDLEPSRHFARRVARVSRGSTRSAHGDTIEVWKVRREMRRVSPSRPRPSPDPRRLVRRGRRRRRRRVRGNNDAPAGVRTRPTHLSLSSLPPQDGPASQERPALVHAGALRARHRALARLRGVVGGGRPVHLVCCQVFFGLALWWGGRSPVVERGRRRQIPRRSTKRASRWFPFRTPRTTPRSAATSCTSYVHVPPRVDRGPRGQQRVRVPPRPP